MRQKGNMDNEIFIRFVCNLLVHAYHVILVLFYFPFSAYKNNKINDEKMKSLGNLLFLSFVCGCESDGYSS